jgi:hypothetical protein
MESAHTGQVGKSHPRGSGFDATVDNTSATAVIVDLPCVRNHAVTWKTYTTIYLTLSQQKYVTSTIFISAALSHCSELMPHQCFNFATEVPASRANDFGLREAARCT